MSTNNIISEHNGGIFIVEFFIFIDKDIKKGHSFKVIFAANSL